MITTDKVTENRCNIRMKSAVLTQLGLIIKAIRCKPQKIRHLPRGSNMRIIETERFSNRYPNAG